MADESLVGGGNALLAALPPDAAPAALPPVAAPAALARGSVPGAGGRPGAVKAALFTRIVIGPRASRAATGGARTAGAASGGAKPGWPGFVSIPLAAYRRHFEIAVFAAYELMQLVCPDMIEAGGGAIINISSVASRLPGNGPYPDRSGGVLPGYGGSKAALEHLTQCAAYDLADHHVAVNALSPSKPILTPGLAYYAREFDETAGADEFARAAVELALVDPTEVTGRTIGHLQVLDGSFRPFQPD
nr:SDR family oxidoreductase [Mycobacterium malmoense]